VNNIPYTYPLFGQQEINSLTDLLQDAEKFTSEHYTKKCREYLKQYYETEVLLTHSCTAALEMSALLLDIKPGDEVILPSYTYVSTANAFAKLGAKLAFVDIQEDTLNIDASQIESVITPRTKAIIPVHYAAIGCDMKVINDIASAHHLSVIEDAAHCIGAYYHGKKPGTLGRLGSLSFHHTKNITSGHGGALIINDKSLIHRAKIIWQKGTNREAFIEGFVDKYTWQDVGSSYVINEMSSALLYSQLQRLEEITQKRVAIWQRYHQAFSDAEIKYQFKRPTVPVGCEHNGHIYYLIAPTEKSAIELRQRLSSAKISAPFHYLPLHLSPAGSRFSIKQFSLPICENIYKRIVRLPIWEGIELHIDRIIEKVYTEIQGL